MKKGKIFGIAALFLGDIAALYLALFATLFIRYGNDFYDQLVNTHFTPFSIIFVLWIIVFYIAGLYDLRRLRNNLDFMKTLTLTLVVDATIAVLFFYLVPVFGITPKTNLFIFLVLFAAIEVFWRRTSNIFLARGEAPNRIILIGESESAHEITEIIMENPQLGYAIIKQISEKDIYENPILLEKIVKETRANTIVVPHHLKQSKNFAFALYSFFGKGISVIDMISLYERILRKIPLTDIEEVWFIENIKSSGQYYDSLKRAGEFLLALIFGIALLPLEILIALLVKLSSPGPALYKQTRVGQNGKLFTLYKFRTMRESEKSTWLKEEKNRITGIGKILRASHLDELPQFINLLRGDVSLVGPRPDFIDFYNELKDVIPYYSIRTIIKPGITGWAQVAFPITESLEQTKERLCYDIYYLKNRSLVLDILIILKTLKTVLSAAGR